MFDSKKLADAVCKKRKRTGQSRRDAADEAGVTYSILTRIENEHGHPSVETLGQVCAWLNRPVGHFFERGEGKGPISRDPHAGGHGAAPHPSESPVHA